MTHSTRAISNKKISLFSEPRFPCLRFFLKEIKYTVFKIFEQTFVGATLNIFIQGPIHIQHQSPAFGYYLIIQQNIENKEKKVLKCICSACIFCENLWHISQSSFYKVLNMRFYVLRRRSKWCVYCSQGSPGDVGFRMSSGFLLMLSFLNSLPWTCSI